MKRDRRRSFVWNCFERMGDFVRCMKCEARLKYCDGGTTSMQNHIARFHPSTTPPERKPKPPDEKPAGLDEKPTPPAALFSLEESVVHPEAPDSPQVTLPSTTAEPVDHVEKKRARRSSAWDFFVRVDNEAHCRLCDTKLKYMSSTTNMIYHIRSKHLNANATPFDDKPQPDEISHSEVTRLICRMIVRDLFPFGVVDGDGFRELLGYTVRGYKMPSVADVARHVEAQFQEATEELRARLGAVEMVALTTDCWTASPAERYLTVSCSFIAEGWQGRSAVLQTHRINDNPATDHLTDTLLSTVETWGISGKVIACVHSNTLNILPGHACARVTWDSVLCFASTLQLAVSDGLSDDLLGVVVAAAKLVKHFNQNSLASAALELKQAQMRLPQHKLIRSSKARWESICDMFERLVEQRWAIKAVLSDRMVTSRQEAQTLEIEDDYWQIIENFTPVLATLKWATTVMSAEADVPISNIYPITFSLLQTHLVAKEHDVEQVSEFKFKVRESLRKRMEVDSPDLASKPALIASMLDPRHKHLSFLTPTGRLAAKVKLHEMVSKTEVITTIVGAKVEKQETLVTPSVSQMAMPTEKGGDIKNTMMLLLGDNYSSSYATDSEAQVDYYLRDISPSLDINPLDWWRVNGPRFPSLAMLARHYLCIPGTSAHSLLSESGQKFARMRTRLNAERVDMMIFLNKNM